MFTTTFQVPRQAGSARAALLRPPRAAPHTSLVRSETCDRTLRAPARPARRGRHTLPNGPRHCGQNHFPHPVGPARNRDEEAWRRLIHLYGPLVDRWCGHRGPAGGTRGDRRPAGGVPGGGREPGYFPPGPGRGHVPWLAPRDHPVQTPRPLPESPGPARGPGRDRRPPPHPGGRRPGTPSRTPRKIWAGCTAGQLELVRDEFEPQTWQAFWRAAVDGHFPRGHRRRFGVTPAAVRKAKSRVTSPAPPGGRRLTRAEDGPAGRSPPRRRRRMATKRHKKKHNNKIDQYFSSQSIVELPWFPRSAWGGTLLRTLCVPSGTSSLRMPPRMERPDVLRPRARAVGGRSGSFRSGACLRRG